MPSETVRYLPSLSQRSPFILQEIFSGTSLQQQQQQQQLSSGSRTLQLSIMGSTASTIAVGTFFDAQEGSGIAQ
jgi:hypothetical protein